MNLDHAVGDKSVFLTEVRAHIEAHAGPLLRDFFGPNYRLNGQGVSLSDKIGALFSSTTEYAYLGAVVSHPNTKAQEWHIDSSW